MADSPLVQSLVTEALSRGLDITVTSPPGPTRYQVGPLVPGTRVQGTAAAGWRPTLLHGTALLALVVIGYHLFKKWES